MDMTFEEAKEELKYMISEDCTDTQMDFVEEIEFAIKCIEKQIPKKHQDTNITRCPACNTRFEAFAKGFKHCPYCGQRIDWSEVE